MSDRPRWGSRPFGVAALAFSRFFRAIHHFLTSTGVNHASVGENPQCSTSWNISS